MKTRPIGATLRLSRDNEKQSGNYYTVYWRSTGINSNEMVTFIWVSGFRVDRGQPFRKESS